MTKTDMINAIAEKSGFTKKDSETALEAVVGAITDALAAGEKVSLIGFGTFEVKDRAARTGVNPRTGAQIEIAASRLPVFKAGKALKDAVSK